MLKLLFIVAILVFIVKEFWFLNDLKKEHQLSSSKISIEKLVALEDGNHTKNIFFNTSLWKPSATDKDDEEKKIEHVDTNSSEITIIDKKNSRQICKGSKCFTIKGMLSKKLLLDDGNTTILLEPNQIILDNLKFIRFTDTKLYFEDTNSSKKYELRFFSYRQQLDKNDTNKTDKDIR